MTPRTSALRVAPTLDAPMTRHKLHRPDPTERSRPVSFSLYPSELAALAKLAQRLDLPTSRALGALLLRGAEWEGWSQGRLPFDEEKGR